MTYNDTAGNRIRVRHVQANILHMQDYSLTYANLDAIVNGTAKDGKPILPDFIGINEGYGNMPAIIDFANANGYGVSCEGINPNDNTGSYTGNGSKNPILFSRKYFTPLADPELVTLHGDLTAEDGSTIASRFASFQKLQDTIKGNVVYICDVHIDQGWTTGGHEETDIKADAAVKAVAKFASEVDNRRLGDNLVIWGGDMNVDFYTDKATQDPQLPYAVYTGKGMVPVFNELSVPNDSTSITHPDSTGGGTTLDWVGSHSADARVSARSFETKTMPNSDHKAVFTRWDIANP